jgi:hypothetical protein
MSVTAKGKLSNPSGLTLSVGFVRTVLCLLLPYAVRIL